MFQKPLFVFSGPEVAQAEAQATAVGGWLAGGWQYGPAEQAAPGWWGVFSAPNTVTRAELLVEADPVLPHVGELSSAWDLPRYERAFAVVREALSRGDSYQVNLTFALTGRAVTDASRERPWSWRSALRLWLELLAPGGNTAAGQGQLGVFACLGSGHPVLCSLSPELFFERQSALVTSRPMKGTAPRSADKLQDALARDGLAASAKNRAENLMITDMIRNDLGRVARPGSVSVSNLFALEAYPTVWQMTSTVSAELPHASIGSVLETLAPCASITGAPKLRTQQLIAEVEDRPRGWYTGTLGWAGPLGPAGGGDARFNVLIRTLEFPDESRPEFRLNVGGGVVWDSTVEAEYAEAWDKSRFLRVSQRDFDLLESLLWEPEGGWFLLDRHWQRLKASCDAFGTTLHRADFDDALTNARDSAVQALTTPVPLKARLLVAPGGRIRAEAAPAGELPEELTWALAPAPLEAASVVLRQHKTTRRDVYQDLAVPGVDQTLYYTSQGLLTESTSCNVVLQVAGELLTPAASAGLLAGTFRAQLLEKGLVREAVLRLEDLPRASSLWFVNSVRRWKKGKPPRPTFR